MGRVDQFRRNQFDVAIIGGGIIGTGIAREAAMRGYRVVLVEKGDFGHATSSASTRLIHGGLRYLEQYDFQLVRQDLREREILLRVAPHLVHPLPFLVPIYRRSLSYRLKLQAGMILYDLLSSDGSLPRHKRLSPEETLAREPILSPEGLQGSFIYYDGQIPSVERLCMENVLSAQEQGAVLLNYVRADGYVKEGVVVKGLDVVDLLTGEEARLQARLVINATGPWLDSTLSRLLPDGKPLLRRTMGVHLVTPRTTRNALVLFAADGRLFFLVPWNGFSLVGTTDTDFTGDPDAAVARTEDIQYLIDGVRPVIPDGPWNQIHYSFAGVRALIRVEAVHESSVPRGHRLVDHGLRDGIQGVASVVGGKITAFRAIAEEAVDLVCRKLGEKRSRAGTDRTPLPGARFSDLTSCISETVTVGTRLGLDEAQCRYLVHIYGSRALEVLALVEEEPRLSARISPQHPDVLAQIRHAVQKEMALKVGDFLLRRSMLGFTQRRGVEYVGIVATEMAQALGWDDVRHRSEESSYRQQIGQGSVSSGRSIERPRWQRPHVLKEYNVEVD